MSTEVKLPSLGQGMESGIVVRWLQQAGIDGAGGEVQQVLAVGVLEQPYQPTAVFVSDNLDDHRETGGRHLWPASC